MKYCKSALGLVLLQLGTPLFAASLRDQSFDADWLFLRADAPGAEHPAFDDFQWRSFAVPNEPATITVRTR